MNPVDLEAGLVRQLRATESEQDRILSGDANPFISEQKQTLNIKIELRADRWPFCPCCEQPLTVMQSVAGKFQFFCEPCKLMQMTTYGSRRAAARAFNKMLEERYYENE